jgi:hypothetical protein
MSVVQVSPSLWCWVWLMLVLRVLVFHPSWCEVTVVRIDAVVWAWVGMVETVRIYQVMWFVMLEFAKDWILGVDTTRQHMPPCVRYGTTCWLIRKALVSLSCWMSGTGMGIPTRPQGARCKRGLRVFCCTHYWETLATVKGAWGYSIVPNKGKPMTKQGIRYRVNLCKGM